MLERGTFLGFKWCNPKSPPFIATLLELNQDDTPRYAIGEFWSGTAHADMWSLDSQGELGFSYMNRMQREQTP